MELFASFASSGDWAKLLLLREGKKVAKGRLYNLSGEVFPSNMETEVLAEYFEKVQWRLRAVDTINEHIDISHGFMELPVDIDEIIRTELQEADVKLKAKQNFWYRWCAV